MSKRVFENIAWMAHAEEVEEISVAQIENDVFWDLYVNKNKPVVIRGAIAHWAALENWKNKKYLADRCGSYDVNIYPHANYTSMERQRQGENSLKFSAALDIMHSAGLEEWTLPSVEISGTSFSELSDDIGDVAFLKNTERPLIYPPQRYFMYKGGGTGWHQHPCDETLLCQIVGEKKVGLLSANKEQNAFVKDVLGKELYWDDKDCFKEVVSSQLRPFVVTLKPGDALYLPPFWWHGVAAETEGFGVSVAKCWRSPAHINGDLSFPAVRDLWLHALRRPGKLLCQLALMTTASMFSKIFLRNAL